MSNTRLILASNSPRRKELLTLMGLTFEIAVSDVDEECTGTPDKQVAELSKRKACSVAINHRDKIVLAADTLVFADKVLGKPKDRADAYNMLTSLSGRWHDVYTGVCLIYKDIILTHTERTRVHFVQLSGDQIIHYIETEEPMDKAGSYAIQGQAGMFIDQIEGSYSNVIGLPMHVVRKLLDQVGFYR